MSQSPINGEWGLSGVACDSGLVDDSYDGFLDLLRYRLDTLAGKELANDTGQHRADVSLAFLLVDSDWAWKHEGRCNVLLQHLVRILRIADLDYLQWPALKALLRECRCNIVSVKDTETLRCGVLLNRAYCFIKRLAGLHGVLKVFHSFSTSLVIMKIK